MLNKKPLMCDVKLLSVLLKQAGSAFIEKLTCFLFSRM